MHNAAMTEKITHAAGFIAALDQSGGSTPGALKLYGIAPDSYDGDQQMFDLVQQMRSRIITAPSFNGDRIIGTILFERTMDATIEDLPTAQYLWQKRAVVPFLKVDKGLAYEKDGVCLMKPIGDLDALLQRASANQVFGTKMRSLINHASRDGIAAIVAQQFELAAQIARHGLVPIIEPEVSINAPDKAAAEALLHDEIRRHLDRLTGRDRVMLKLTIPTEADLYLPLHDYEQVLRIVALSGGYKRDEACQLLARNHRMIASFSRALVEDLRVQMHEAQFNAALELAVDEIFQASTHKT